MGIIRERRDIRFAFHKRRLLRSVVEYIPQEALSTTYHEAFDARVSHPVTEIRIDGKHEDFEDHAAIERNVVQVNGL